MTYGFTCHEHPKQELHRQLPPVSIYCNAEWSISVLVQVITKGVSQNDTKSNRISETSGR